MTYGKRQFESLDGAMRRLIPPFHQAVDELLLMVDADSSAFNSYMVRRNSAFTKNLELVRFGAIYNVCLIVLQAALKMPKNSAEEMKR